MHRQSHKGQHHPGKELPDTQGVCLIIADHCGGHSGDAQGHAAVLPAIGGRAGRCGWAGGWEEWWQGRWGGDEPPERVERDCLLWQGKPPGRQAASLLLTGGNTGARTLSPPGPPTDPPPPPPEVQAPVALPAAAPAAAAAAAVCALLPPAPCRLLSPLLLLLPCHPAGLRRWPLSGPRGQRRSCAYCGRECSWGARYEAQRWRKQKAIAYVRNQPPIWG